jgi:O-antigen/teichoic acid export membrane protein
VLGIVAVPIVIYLGGGIVGATAALMAASLLTLAGHIYMSNRLLPGLTDLTIDRAVVRPLLKFGSGLVVGGVAAVMLVNLEKLVLARVTSVEVLAYYSVAFSFAMMATMFSGAMLQSLMPAFSQLMTPDRREQLNGLFSRALRMNIIGMLPILTGLFVIARPLFTVWAGPDFGRESTLPFYILLGGLFFNLLAFVPLSLLMAAGRTDILAKLYWIELFPYLALIAVLTWRFGAVGAATAWSIRVCADAIVMAVLAGRAVGLSFQVFKGKRANLAVAFLVLAPPLIVAASTAAFPVWLVFLLAASLGAYALLAWKKFLEADERTWFFGRLAAIVGR